MSGLAINLTMEQKLLLAAASDDVSLIGQLIDTAKTKGAVAADILRPALLESLEKGNLGAIRYLLDHGADPLAADAHGKTPLMAAAVKGSVDLVNLLSSKGADINSKDIRGRNVLHYLALEEKQDQNHRHDIIDLLLKQEVDVNARDEFGRSPLHWVCVSGDEEFVRQLLTSPIGKIDVNILDAGTKTPLHLAAAHVHAVIAQLLIEHGANVNAQSMGNWTPLHKACEQGSDNIVELLLNGGADINARLTDGATPLHTAAQGGHVKVLERLLASGDSKLRAKDVFGNTAFLRAAQNRQIAAMNVLAPFNRQNLGKLSTYERIACESLYATIVDFGGGHDENSKHRIRKVAIYDLLYGKSSVMAQLHATSSPLPDSQEGNIRWINLPANNLEWIEALFAKQFNESNDDFSGLDSLKSALKAQNRGQHSSLCLMKPSFHIQDSQNRNGRCSYTFLPYLHFETDQGRQAMANAIRQLQHQFNPTQKSGTAVSPNELLIQAYLSPDASTYIRQTLDQSSFHNVDTSLRDQDQVVYRYQIREKGYNEDSEIKIIMVDQLWMWILGDNLLVTAFPERWQQPQTDPMGVLNDILGDIELSGHSPSSIYDLSTIVTSRCCSIFDRLDADKNQAQFLDMFKITVLNAVEQERQLYGAFNRAAAAASAWMSNHRRGRTVEQEDHQEEDGPIFVDDLLDINKEMALFNEAGDIKDEVHMLLRVLEDQFRVLEDFHNALGKLPCPIPDSRVLLLRLQDELDSIKTRTQDLAELQRKMDHISSTTAGLLDMKEKHAGGFEARFARDQAIQAAESANQGTSIFIFTIATIIFLPMSFISSFFTINIKEFPKDDSGNNALPLAIVSKYVFGIGLGISSLLVIIALCVGLWAQYFTQTFWFIKNLRRVKNPRLGRSLHEESLSSINKLPGLGNFVADARKNDEVELVANRSLTDVMTTSQREQNERSTVIRRTSDVERGLRYPQALHAPGEL